jgi:hypothetical protein
MQRLLRLFTSAGALVLLSAAPLTAQQRELQLILDRIERLEQQNRQLMEEVRALRTELAARDSQPAPPAPDAPAAPSVAERLAVQERRVEEHAQTKVETNQKVLARLNGMVLFNAFHNGRFAGGNEAPTVASLTAGPEVAGGTVRQSLIGFDFEGGQSIGGGKLSASIQMDFFAGTSSTLNQLFRVRTAAARVDWSRTTLLVGQEKPIFSPRDPTSFSNVGVSPLTGSGNPWLWLPQVRVQQRFGFGEDTELRADIGVLQTSETAAQLPGDFVPTLARVRPALEGRFQFRRGRLEIAPGFHLSTTHVAATSVPSNAVSIDWAYSPWDKLEFTGFAFNGANLANVGTLRQGFTVIRPGEAIAIRSRGGWAQVAIRPAPRISVHLIAGQQDDHDGDLRFGGIGKNQTYMANIMYRLGTNMIVSLERSHVRTLYLPATVRTNNHYDLAFAYLF